MLGTGGYLYTKKENASAYIANLHQTEEILKELKKFPKQLSILDVGCGDGTYTIAIEKNIHPKKIFGIDPAKNAISIAKKNKSKVRFLEGNIYSLSKQFRKNQFEVAVIRGVLHHVYDPLNALKEVSKVVDTVIILEPNGFNPILKIIEKISPYHRKHEERSYWPPLLASWIRSSGYKIVTQSYCGIVPYFCPSWLAKTLRTMQPFFESVPIVNKFYSGVILIVAKK